MVEYINKSALVAEIEKIKYETNYEPFTDEVVGKICVCRRLLSFLNTIEVKEVEEKPVSEDLEKAAYEYAKSKHKDTTLQQIVSWDFKAGAQWQALHSLETIKGMEEQAFLAGVEAEQINQNYGKDLMSEIERLIKSYSPIQSSEGKYKVEAYNELLEFINSNCLEISRSGNSHIGENRELERIISKACDWLADNYSKYIITNGLATIFSATIDFDTIRMIEDLKKAIDE